MEDDISNLTPDKINNMSYNEIMVIVKETSRPPGGSNSILTIAQKSFLKKGEKVLEIGTNTGVTAIELAKLTQATIYATDINSVSLEEAKNRAKIYSVRDFVKFELENATNLSYPKEMFDMVICGNVTSLIENKDKALNEYIRVLKTGGILAAIPMYYIKEPSKELINKVSKAIQIQIKPLKKEFWTKFFNLKPLRIYWMEDYVFDSISPKKIDKFVEDIISRDHLKLLSKESTKTLKNKYKEYMNLFRKNLYYVGYSIILLRKEMESFDQELFISHKANKND